MTPLVPAWLRGRATAPEDEWEEWGEEEAEEALEGHAFGPPGSLAVGLLATVPWVLAYEWALSESTGARRNVSEILLGSILRPLGPYADLARVLVWVLIGAAALVRALQVARPLGPRLLRTVLEGALAALSMGPALMVIGPAFGDAAPALPLAEYYPEHSPSLAEVAFVSGGAAYEELCFRLGAFSVLFLLVRHLLTFFGAALGPARFAAEVVGMLGSAAVFAAFHLERLTSLVGWRGEAFDAALFFWRLLAGILLWTLLRWRGLGVAVWAHALFNLGLVLGLGPAVLRTP